MSLTATNLGGWMFAGFEPGIEFREKPTDASAEQKREFVVYRRKRRGKGNVNFTSEQGSTKVPTSIKSDLSGSDRNKFPTAPSGLSKFICTRDTLRPIGGDGSGIVEEEQEWTGYTAWADYDAATDLA